jgi:hypothetical protein
MRAKEVPLAHAGKTEIIVDLFSVFGTSSEVLAEWQIKIWMGTRRAGRGGRDCEGDLARSSSWLPSLRSRRRTRHLGRPGSVDARQLGLTRWSGVPCVLVVAWGSEVDPAGDHKRGPSPPGMLSRLHANRGLLLGAELPKSNGIGVVSGAERDCVNCVFEIGKIMGRLASATRRCPAASGGRETQCRRCTIRPVGRSNSRPKSTSGKTAHVLWCRKLCEPIAFASVSLCFPDFALVGRLVRFAAAPGTSYWRVEVAQ